MSIRLDSIGGDSMNYRTAIEILGLCQRFSAEELQKRYKELAKKYHPDSGSTGDVQKFMALKESYEFLSDPNNALCKEKDSADSNGDIACPLCNGNGWRREKIKTARGYIAQKIKCSACNGVGRK